jgi:hypothetical protein
VLLAWPVKLTFAPLLADHVSGLMARDHVTPLAKSVPPPLPTAVIGSYPWEDAAWQTIA